MDFGDTLYQRLKGETSIIVLNYSYHLGW